MSLAHIPAAHIQAIHKDIDGKKTEKLQAAVPTLACNAQADASTLAPASSALTWKERLAFLTGLQFAKHCNFIIWGWVKTLVPLVNIKIAGKWMFIPLKMVSTGIDPYPYAEVYSENLKNRTSHATSEAPKF